MAFALQIHLKTLSEADLFQSALALILWMALVLLAALPALAPKRWPLAGPGWSVRRLHAIFFILLVAALFAWRAPELSYPGQYDIDESHLLSIAQRYTTDGVAWRSGDGETIGPLDSYVLVWAAPLGLHFNYLVARLTGIACLVVTLACLFKSASLLVGRRFSPLMVLSAATFYLFAWYNGFVEYSSEHLPVALLSAAVWLLLVFWRRPERTVALALGILLGAIPFAKLQAAPLAVYLSRFALALLLLRGGAAPGVRLRSALALFAGCLIVPLLILLPVVATGTGPDFFHRYILTSLRYRREWIYPESESYFRIFFSFIKGEAFIWGLLGFSALVLLARLFFRAGRMDRTWLTGLGIAGGYLLLTVFAVLKSQMPFIHYLLLLPCPLVLFAAWSMRGIRGADRSPFGIRYATVLPLLFLFLAVLSQTIGYARHFHDRPQLSDRSAPDPVTEAIKAVSRPGDTMAIWGWSPQYFILTGNESAAREIAGFCLIMTGQDFDYYREIFLSDIEKSKPRIFIDASGAGIGEGGLYPAGWPHPVEKARYTMYPPLAAYIDSHYHLESEVAPATGDPPVFIYLRNE